MASITIRDVPDDVHVELAARAALARQSLQDYLRSQLIAIARRSDTRALMERVQQRKQSPLDVERILEYRDRDRR
jgi:plasmid stability protein